jgi:hypothetical protein
VRVLGFQKKEKTSRPSKLFTNMLRLPKFSFGEPVLFKFYTLLINNTGLNHTISTQRAMNETNRSNLIVRVGHL